MKTTLKYLVFFAILVTLVCLSAQIVSAECQVNGSGSYTLPDAVAAAAPGDVITLVADETVSANLTFDKNLTVNTANNAKLTVGGGAFLTFDGAVTFNDAYVQLQSTNATPLRISTSGNVTLKDCTFDGHTQPSSSPRTVLLSGAAKLAIDGGTYHVVPFSSDGRFISLGSTTAGGYLLIKGGTFVGNSGTRCIIRPSGAAPVVISGGSFEAYQNVIFAESYTGVITVNDDDETPSFVRTAGNDASCLFDLNTAGTVNISAGNFSSIKQIINCRNAGLRLNISGGSFTTSVAGTSNAPISGVFYVSANPSVNAITVSGGTFTATGAFATIYDAGVAGATLSISAADPTAPPSFSSVWRVFNLRATTTLNISGGSFVTTTAQHMIWQNGGTTVTTITGGTFGSVDYSATCLVGGSVGTINISGGNFRSGSSRFVFSEGANVEVSGGNFAAPAGAQDIFDLSGANKNYTATFRNLTISDATGVFRYRTSGALNILSGSYVVSGSVLVLYNANAVGTVTLGGTADALTMQSTASGYPVLSRSNATGNLVIGSNARLISAGRVLELESAANVTINEGAYLQSGANASGLAVWNNSGSATITMNGGLITGTSSNAEGAPITGTYRGIGSSTGATIIINGGTIHTRGAALYAETTVASITVNGGTLQRISGAYNGNFIVNINNATPVTVNGGTFIGLNDGIIKVSGGTLTIKNGTFTRTGEYRELAFWIVGTANIYGGVFTSNTVSLLQAGTDSGSATLNVYGGFFTSTYTGNSHTYSVRTSTNNATVASTANIYGGVFVKESTRYWHTFFSAANPSGNATVNLVSYVCYGNGAIYQCGEDAEDVSQTIRYPAFARRASLNNLSAVSGASVRLNDEHPGIRFTSVVSAAFIERIESVMLPGTSISYGTLIVPVDYLDGISFTEEALIAASKIYLKIPTVHGITVESDDSLTIRASMIDIKTGNYTRKFASMLYADYTDGEGILRRCYGNYDESDNARSVSDVAQIALNDLRDVSTGDYLNRFEGRYSRYSVRQRAILTSFGATYSPKAVDLYIIAGQSNASGYSGITDAFASAHTETYEHVLYSGAAGSAYPGSLNYSDTALAPVSIGLGGAFDGSRMGAELGMAEVLSQYYKGSDYTGAAGTVDRDACIVKWADGGTHLMDPFVTTSTKGSDYREGSWTPPSYLETYGKNNNALSGKQYTNLLCKVESAITELRKAGYNRFSVKGVFWMQGEAERNVTSVLVNGLALDVDMCSFESPYAYPALFNALISDLRADLGAITGENLATLPFVVGEISDSFGRTHTENQDNFVAMQRELAREFADVYTVDTAKLAVGYRDSDSAHWTADDMLLIGKMVGTKLLNVVCAQNLAHPALTTALAPDAIVSVTGGGTTTYYNHLAYALNNAPAGATVTLLDDVTLHTALNIANQNAIIFNGNNKILTSGSADTALRFIGTDLTIRDLTVIHAAASPTSRPTYSYAALTASNFVWKTALGATPTVAVKNSVGTTLFEGDANTDLNFLSALCPENGSIELSDDITSATGANFTKNMTVNGNSYTVTMTESSGEHALQLRNEGTVATVNDLNVTHGGTSNSVYISYHYSPNTTLYVNGGVYQGNYWGFVANAADAALHIDGADISTRNAATVNYSLVHTNSTATITVENATLTQNGTAGTCIHLAANVENTLIVGSNTAFILPAGTTNSPIRCYVDSILNVPLDDATITVSYDGGVSDAQITASDIVITTPA